MTQALAWWQSGVIYQVYPRSFMDSNADGVGDLAGITSRLDYVAWLGVDAIWISPIYPSPMKDFGYDVADYRDIHPLFGNLDDLDALIAAAHGRGLRVLLDFVPNHTSDQHPWFVESRSSRENPKRDWYIWADPKPAGSPPNNWRSVFGGSAWTLDPPTGQYYYHAYLPEQPDLNWRSPAVREEMLDTLRFWLDRGVDGFRVDAVRQLRKDDRLRDNPPNPDWRPGDNPYDEVLPVYTTDRPETMEVVREFRQVLDEYPDRLFVGELTLPIERLIRYYGAAAGEAIDLPSNFHMIYANWDASTLKALIDRYEAALPVHAWPNWVLGNHDQHRIASRVGRPQARVAALLLLTLRGTPTLYYGDELGMIDVPAPPERIQDPFGRNVPGQERDPERTPMQWDSGPFAGFSTVEPWLPVAADAGTVNVEAQRDDPKSMLALYRRLLRLRRETPALKVGAYVPWPADKRVLAFERRLGDVRLLTVLNLGASPAPYALREVRGTVVLSATGTLDRQVVQGALRLGGDEGLLIRLED
ncbi:MAG TPA: alpha-amylase family glycosyl hydrolase [Thermomicrobiales bacterium]|nr:alpha-amylase family glycosyl hydrolase [Thermomicrobiales bacterium]